MIVFPTLIPGKNFLFPGTGREITKCHGKGNLYSRESRETGIPAHPWVEQAIAVAPMVADMFADTKFGTPLLLAKLVTPNFW